MDIDNPYDFVEMDDYRKFTVLDIKRIDLVFVFQIVINNSLQALLVQYCTNK